MVALLSAFVSDWLSLGQYADWLDSSTEVAKATLDELGISYVRIGQRGMYRISVASIADVYGVPMKDDETEGDISPNTPLGLVIDDTPTSEDA